MLSVFKLRKGKGAFKFWRAISIFLALLVVSHFIISVKLGILTQHSSEELLDSTRANDRGDDQGLLRTTKSLRLGEVPSTKSKAPQHQERIENVTISNTLSDVCINHQMAGQSDVGKRLLKQHASIYRSRIDQPIRFEWPKIFDQSDDAVALGIMKEGDSGAWKVVNWTDPISDEDESIFSCEWSTFTSSSGEEARICDSSPVKSTKCRYGRYLVDVWYRAYGGDGPYYVDIGAEFGACTLEVLLETNAKVLAFEPHPYHVYTIRKMMLELDQAYQSRVTLFPIGLSDKRNEEKVMHGTHMHMLPIRVERLDHVLNMNIIPPEMKMIVSLEVRGWECRILDGMGSKIAKQIEMIKLKWDSRTSKCQGGENFIVKLQNHFGSQIFRRYDGLGTYAMPLRNGMTKMERRRHICIQKGALQRRI
mmetsp:Transcript_18227/g.39184  ORF Transcript_18227/g.39184 Transcript_18227/m.39184 type:complete len:421 (+) Transcript_18227:255-1517(+)|eukprot:CAMPEP_0172552806 /NCGR_PEP_ID=MMETSP1067-20121228/47205_1 /TAXON_ID=265564 ORGANISM="Thalassiosira punctigera, Strain Tpunct2005C2" /NCGR_SAMPLE_ID=MMETSP1067 /ASSEMBLY_ACC=CAM_ASM_000444 /LENGTH=420 /DNA_ID=CAMNT_0013340867 /DNA_START=124 /DNA_END=1386 /DNA_ORIENTATION=-